MRKLFKNLIVLAFVFVLFGPAWAETFEWVKKGYDDEDFMGSWEDPSNWVGNRVPTPGSDVRIERAEDVLINKPVNINSLYLGASGNLYTDLRLMLNADLTTTKVDFGYGLNVQGTGIFRSSEPPLILTPNAASALIETSVLLGGNFRTVVIGLSYPLNGVIVSVPDETILPMSNEHYKSLSAKATSGGKVNYKKLSEAILGNAQINCKSLKLRLDDVDMDFARSGSKWVLQPAPKNSKAYVWTAKGDGLNWGDPGNWSPRGVPPAGSNVIIDMNEWTSYTVRVNKPVNINSLYMNGDEYNLPSLELNADLTTKKLECVDRGFSLMGKSTLKVLEPAVTLCGGENGMFVGGSVSINSDPIPVKDVVISIATDTRMNIPENDLQLLIREATKGGKVDYEKLTDSILGNAQINCSRFALTVWQDGEYEEVPFAKKNGKWVLQSVSKLTTKSSKPKSDKSKSSTQTNSGTSGQSNSNTSNPIEDLNRVNREIGKVSDALRQISDLLR